MGKYVAAADVTTTRGEDGAVVTVRTKPPEKMTVTLRLDKSGQATGAEVIRDPKGVTLTLGEKGTGTMKRGGVTDFLKDLPANPIVAAGPDWTDVLQVVRRYDASKGGKQEFAGLSIDPMQGFQNRVPPPRRRPAAGDGEGQGSEVGPLPAETAGRRLHRLGRRRRAHGGPCRGWRPRRCR